MSEKLREQGPKITRVTVDESGFPLKPKGLLTDGIISSATMTEKQREYLRSIVIPGPSRETGIH